MSKNQRKLRRKTPADDQLKSNSRRVPTPSLGGKERDNTNTTNSSKTTKKSTVKKNSRGKKKPAAKTKTTRVKKQAGTSKDISSSQKTEARGTFETKDGKISRKQSTNRRGRPKKGEENTRSKLEINARRSHVSQESDKAWKESIRDIANVPDYSSFKHLDMKAINWERRKACRLDPLLDLKTYFPKIFYLDWADYQKGLINSLEDRVYSGGKKAFGCPRGGGKTAICRGMIIRAAKYGMRNFMFFIGSKEPKAIQTLNAVKTLMFRSQEFQQDFPEIAYPIYRLEGRSTSGSQGQTFRGERTHVKWGGSEVQFPTMLFDEEDISDYLIHEPESVMWLPDEGINIDKFIIKSSGAIIRVAGIDGSIRGEAEIHPTLLTQPRPDLVLLDDVQKDQKADSPKACDDLETLIESAIDYLAAPDIAQTTLMPCTVIREDDAADRYLTPSKKPTWTGERHGVVKVYPEGIDDETITGDTETGRLWNEYAEVRESSFLRHGDNREGNEFYLKHREAMDEGFEISWKGRYKQSSPDPNQNEISALQAAMNARFKNLGSYQSELQNRPRRITDGAAVTLTPAQVAENVTNIGRAELLPSWKVLTAFIDVQDEILFYGILATDHNMTGQFIDYGTYPRPTSRFFTKNQTYGWTLLSNMFFRDNPMVAPEGKTKKGKKKAPLDAKIYYALSQLVPKLLSQKYPCDADGSVLQIKSLGIDMKWSATSDTVKRFIREYNDPRVVGYQGHAFLPSFKQLEEYKPTDGWIYEHEQYPHVQESTWVLKRDASNFPFILADVNRIKTNLMKRLGSPRGTEGAITLFSGLPEDHRMFAEHVADSEYPEPIIARGMKKDCWKPKPGREAENDYLDVAVGCLCLSAVSGASIKTKQVKEKRETMKKERKSLRQIYNAKRKRR